MNLFFVACLVSFASVAFIVGFEIFTGWSEAFASIRRRSIWIQIPLFLVVEALTCAPFLLLSWLLFWSPDLPTSQDFLKVMLMTLVGPMILAVLCQVTSFRLVNRLLGGRGRRIGAIAR